jgi:hypothetical protein
MLKLKKNYKVSNINREFMAMRIRLFNKKLTNSSKQVLLCYINIFFFLFFLDNRNKNHKLWLD